MKISDVKIQSLRNHRAGGNCPIGSGRRLVLLMALEKYTSIDDVDFLQVGIVDITDKVVDKNVKMLPPSRASVIVMVDCNAINIFNICFHLLQ